MRNVWFSLLSGFGLKVFLIKSTAVEGAGETVENLRFALWQQGSRLIRPEEWQPRDGKNQPVSPVSRAWGILSG